MSTLPPHSPAPLRLLAWNLLEGGLAPGPSGRRLPIAVRREAAVRLVRAIDPDVLVLNEALYAEVFDGQQEDYAALFGFPESAVHTYDGAWGNAILSRLPIEARVSRLLHSGPGHNRGFLAVRVRRFGDEPLWIGTYHPHPDRAPAKRADDIGRFIACFDGRPAVLAGDLNAVSPDDPIDEALLAQNLAHFKSAAAARQSARNLLDAGRELFGRVLPPLGWQDGMPPDGRRISLPTALIRRPGDRGLRIDHLLVSPGVRVLSASIWQAAEADAASDHYPLVAELA